MTLRTLDSQGQAAATDLEIPADAFNVWANENGVAAGTALLVDVVGNLRLTNSFVIAGHITLKDTQDAITVAIDGDMNLGGTAKLTISNASANIVKGPNPGFVFNLPSLSTNFGIGGVFTVIADARIQFNTRAGSGLDANDLGIPRGNFHVGVDQLRVTLFNALPLINGSGFIERVDDVYRMDVGMTADFGIVKASGRAFFSSEGEFLLDVSGSLNLGRSGFGIFGNASLLVSYLDNNGTTPFGNQIKTLYVNGKAYVSGKAFGVTLVGLELHVDYNEAAGGEIGVTVQFDLGAIRVRPHFTIGHLKRPSVDAVLATIDANGNLVLAVDDKETQRWQSHRRYYLYRWSQE